MGSDFARLFARYGADVALGARRLGALEALKADIEKESGIDIFVNNAGISSIVPALEMTPETWAETFDANLRGLFFMAWAAARRVRDHGRPVTLVSISSITGMRPLKGIAACATSKAAVSHLIKVLALEWARYGIRVNAICPGFFSTEMTVGYYETAEGKARVARTPTRRLGAVGDLEAAALLLASDAGKHITGIDLPVDGGHLLSGL
ncbi:SDR family oxidoreductase [bacterium]|nr:SDR family oxidoreductase [bacterium]